MGFQQGISSLLLIFPSSILIREVVHKKISSHKDSKVFRRGTERFDTMVATTMEFGASKKNSTSNIWLSSIKVTLSISLIVNLCLTG
jgi:hypothetical protein